MSEVNPRQGRLACIYFFAMAGLVIGNLMGRIPGAQGADPAGRARARPGPARRRGRRAHGVPVERFPGPAHRQPQRSDRRLPDHAAGVSAARPEPGLVATGVGLLRAGRELRRDGRGDEHPGGGCRAPARQALHVHAAWHVQPRLPGRCVERRGPGRTDAVLALPHSHRTRPAEPAILRTRVASAGPEQGGRAQGRRLHLAAAGLARPGPADSLRVRFRGRRG